MTPTGLCDERHLARRDWLAEELERIQPNELWMATLLDDAGQATPVPAVELIVRIDNGENLIDQYEIFVEDVVRAVAR